jgi:hypothetical protein
MMVDGSKPCQLMPESDLKGTGLPDLGMESLAYNIGNALKLDERNRRFCKNETWPRSER